MTSRIPNNGRCPFSFLHSTDTSPRLLTLILFRCCDYLFSFEVLIPDEDDHCPFRVPIRPFSFHFLILHYFQRRVSSNVSSLSLFPISSRLVLSANPARNLEWMPGPSGFIIRGCESVARASRKSLWKSLLSPINTDDTPSTIEIRRDAGAIGNSSDPDRASRLPSLPGIPPNRCALRRRFFLANISGSLSRRLSSDGDAHSIG